MIISMYISIIYQCISHCSNVYNYYVKSMSLFFMYIIICQCTSIYQCIYACSNRDKTFIVSKNSTVGSGYFRENIFASKLKFLHLDT